MKSIREHVEGGIATLEDLIEALQLAIQMEFATLPPYLCAQWSIRSDPDRVEAVLHRVASQEMHHLALAGNLMAALGGAPRLTGDDFLPRYPTNVLPGGIAQPLAIDLRPLSLEQLAVFMQIEHPAFPPVALLAEAGPPTIGDFYDAIIAGIGAVRPPMNPAACAVPVPNVPPLRDLAGAIDCLELIKAEGEGLRDSPDQPSGERPSHAHYYLFKQLHEGRRLVWTGGRWSFSGAPIRLPETHPFDRVDGAAEASREFRRTLARLLRNLEACWSEGAAPDVGGMFRLKLLGENLIRRGLRPEFVWDPG